MGTGGGGGGLLETHSVPQSSSPTASAPGLEIVFITALRSTLSCSVSFDCHGVLTSAIARMSLQRQFLASPPKEHADVMRPRSESSFVAAMDMEMGSQYTNRRPGHHLATPTVSYEALNACHLGVHAEATRTRCAMGVLFTTLLLAGVMLVGLEQWSSPLPTAHTVGVSRVVPHHWSTMQQPATSRPKWDWGLRKGPVVNADVARATHRLANHPMSRLRGTSAGQVRLSAHTSDGEAEDAIADKALLGDGKGEVDVSAGRDGEAEAKAATDGAQSQAGASRLRQLPLRKRTVIYTHASYPDVTEGVFRSQTIYGDRVPGQQTDDNEVDGEWEVLRLQVELRAVLRALQRLLARDQEEARLLREDAAAAASSPQQQGPKKKALRILEVRTRSEALVQYGSQLAASYYKLVLPDANADLWRKIADAMMPNKHVRLVWKLEKGKAPPNAVKDGEQPGG